MEISKEQVAAILSKETGCTINAELVVKLPSDGCPGHMATPEWEVYAVRSGEFTLLLYAFADGTLKSILA